MVGGYSEGYGDQYINQVLKCEHAVGSYKSFSLIGHF